MFMRLRTGLAVVKRSCVILDSIVRFGFVWSPKESVGVWTWYMVVYLLLDVVEFEFWL